MGDSFQTSLICGGGTGSTLGAGGAGTLVGCAAGGRGSRGASRGWTWGRYLSAATIFQF